MLAPMLKTTSVSEMSPLICPDCDSILGIPTVYEREGRLAWRLQRGSIQTARR